MSSGANKVTKNENEIVDKQLLSACQPLPGTGTNSVIASQITEISGLRRISQNSTSVVCMYRRNNYAQKSYRSNIVFPAVTWFDSRS